MLNEICMSRSSKSSVITQMWENPLFERPSISSQAFASNHLIQKMSSGGEILKMVEEWDMEITFLPTNTSKIHLHVEQLLQNIYWTLAEDLSLSKRQETPNVPG